MATENGKLYVIATPIGNLGDISFRAVEVLRQADVIAAEDTRHIKILLQHYGINRKVVSFHQHNEERAASDLLKQLRSGLSIALVSDAGTPLVSDPGMPLVRMAKEAGIEVSPVPGPCALIAALSVAGLPTARFSFEGFAPRTPTERKAFFKAKSVFPDTWIFYESCHRVLASLRDMAEVITDERRIVIARELTKLHETIEKDSIPNLLARVEADENMRKGEFVFIVEGAPKKDIEAGLSPEQQKILESLLKACSVKTAVSLASEITGVRKKQLYQAALEMEAAKKD